MRLKPAAASETDAVAFGIWEAFDGHDGSPMVLYALYATTLGAKSSP
jgi:hypothetical protein